MSTQSAANDPDDRWRKLYGVAARVETTANLAEIAMILRVAQRAFPETAETTASRDELLALLRPYPAAKIEAYKISPRIENVKNDDAVLIELVA